MSTGEKDKIHAKHDNIPQSISETNNIEILRDDCTNPWGEIVESHQDKESKCEESENIPARPDEQEEGRYECEKNIGDFREFTRLILLEGEVCWKLEIVIDPCIIAKISTEIFILRLSTCCHDSCSFILDDR